MKNLSVFGIVLVGIISLFLFSSCEKEGGGLEVFKVSVWKTSNYKKGAHMLVDDPWSNTFYVMETKRLSEEEVLDRVKKQERYIALIQEGRIDPSKTKYIGSEIIRINEFVVYPYVDTTWVYNVETQKWWKHCSRTTYFATYIPGRMDPEDRIKFLFEKVYPQHQGLCDSFAVDFLGVQKDWAYMPVK